MSNLGVRVGLSKLLTGVGHMYVQADNRGWTYIHMSNPMGLLLAWTYVFPTYVFNLDIRTDRVWPDLYVQPGQMYVQPDYAFSRKHL